MTYKHRGTKLGKLMMENKLLVPNGKKRCSRCDQIKSVEEFVRYKKGYGHEGKETAKYGCCLECARIGTKKWATENAGKIREYSKGRRGSDFITFAFQVARTRARNMKIPFDLTKVFLTELYEKQNKVCSISGLPFDLTYSKEFKRNPYRPSLDRIVPRLGYTKGNVRFILLILNIGINEWGEDIFSTAAEAFLRKKSLGSK